MITAKLDVTKIDKARLFKGAKGTYLDIALIETPNSEYGDYMIVQQVSKEERDKNIKGAILGNAKILQRRGDNPSPKANRPAESSDGPAEDLPF
jgi:hypothetical protein